MSSVQAEPCSTRLRAESNTLTDALDAHQRGWSVIPLLGGKHTLYGKRPATEWKQYQARQATERQIETWFSESYTAYGVVCGSISNLIVIDFDDVEIQATSFRSTRICWKHTSCSPVCEKHCMSISEQSFRLVPPSCEAVT